MEERKIRKDPEEDKEVAKRMRRTQWLIGIIVCLMCMTGCSKEITEGEIYDKEFKEETTTVIMTPIVHTNGKTTSTSIIPIVHRYPDRWCIRIRSLERNEDGDYETAEYYTTEEVFNECDIGDIFSYDEDRDYSEEPVEKERR